MAVEKCEWEDPEAASRILVLVTSWTMMAFGVGEYKKKADLGKEDPNLRCRDA